MLDIDRDERPSGLGGRGAYATDADFDDLLADLPRGRHASDVGAPSAAHFESLANVLATPSLRFEPRRNRGSKLFLGVVGGRVVTGEPLPDGRVNRWIEGGTPIGVGDDRHHLLVAGSRAGKGRSALTPVLLTLPATTSVLCLDPKGDLARYTARYRDSVLGQSVALLDPFGVAGPSAQKYRRAFNAIELLLRSSRDTLVANARLIADATIVTGRYRDEHWDESAKQILAGLCAHVATHARYAGARDLVTVWELSGELAAADPDDPDVFWLAEEMQATDAADGMVRAAARQFYDRTGGEFSSVLSNLRKHLDWVSYGCMRDALRGPSVDLRDLKRKLMSLYVVLPAMRMDALRGWLRLVVQLQLAACEEERELLGDPCVLMLDEFHSLGRLTALEVAVAQVAGLGAKLYIALQNLSQLQPYEKNYETFLANAGCVQVMGCADESTLNYVSGRLGQAQALGRSAHAPTFEQATRQAVTGESWATTAHPLLTSEEVARYFSRDDRLLRQLVLRPGYRPLVLQRAFYDKHALFEGRFDEA